MVDSTCMGECSWLTHHAWGVKGSVWWECEWECEWVTSMMEDLVRAHVLGVWTRWCVQWECWWGQVRGALMKGGCIGGMNEVVCAMGMLIRASTGSINERWMYWEYECVYDERGLWGQVGGVLMKGGCTGGMNEVLCNGRVDEGKYGEH